MAIDIQWILDDASLARHCAEWRKLPYVALDTEFMRVDTFYPIAGLLQVGDGQRAYLVDPLVVKDWAPFAELLEDPAVTKVLHDAFKKTLEDPKLLETLDRFYMPTIYMSTADYTAYAERTFKAEKATVEKLGLAKKS